MLTMNERHYQNFEASLAEKYGATIVEDPARGHGWGQFDLKGWRVWFCAKGWARARLKDDHWCDHVYHKNLEEAFKAIEQDACKSCGGTGQAETDQLSRLRWEAQ